MPNETVDAVSWALQQQIDTEFGPVQVTANEPMHLVDKVREYFNNNSIKYTTFSYDDLKAYL